MTRPMTRARTTSAQTNAQSNTLPGLLLARAASNPMGQALRYHHLGIWEPQSWRLLEERTRNFGNGLAEIGVQERDVVGLVASNQPRWLTADLAIQGLGAITLAIDPGFSPATVVTLLQTHGASTAVVGNQEQYDKIADSLQLLPQLRRIVVMETRGIHALNDAIDASVQLEGRTVTTFLRVEQGGSSSSDIWSATAAALDPTQTCTVEAHLDRSTGAKPTLRAHPASSASLLAAADDLVSRLGAHAGDELYPVASFADPVERALSVAMTLRVGAVLNIGEGGPLQPLEIRSVQPTIAHLPATHLHAILEDVDRRKSHRGLRRIAVDRVLNGSGETSANALGDRRITFGLLTALAVASVMVHRLLVAQHGMIRIGIITALATLVGAVLVLGGYGVRPFIRRAYGLGSAHSLLTSPDTDAETQRFLGALRLAPIIEQRRPNSPVESPDRSTK